MPIQRFRRVEDMPPVAPPAPGPGRAERLRALWGVWSRILPPLDLRGVRRYRSVEEAARDREAAVVRRARHLLAERRIRDTESVSGQQGVSGVMRGIRSRNED